METTDTKNFFTDKVKMAMTGVFTVFALIAYILLVKVDIGSLSKLKAFRARAEETLSVLTLLSDYKGYMGEFDTKFVSNKDTNWLIGELTNTAKKRSIVLDLVKPVEEQELFGYKVLSVLMEGKASYHQIGEFIAEIENNEKFFIIVDFNVKAEDNSFGGESFSGEGFPDVSMSMPGVPFEDMGMMQGAGHGMRQNKQPFKEERATYFRLVVASLSIEK